MGAGITITSSAGNYLTQLCSTSNITLYFYILNSALIVDFQGSTIFVLAHVNGFSRNMKLHFHAPLGKRIIVIKMYTLC